MVDDLFCERRMYPGGSGVLFCEEKKKMKKKQYYMICLVTADFFSDAVSGCKKRISKSEKGNGTAKCDTAGCTSGCKKYFKAEKI